MSNHYEMPPVAVGTIVLWHPGGVKAPDPLPAIVSRVTSRSVALSVISAESYNFMVRDGVRHLSDPELSRDVVREDGAWDFTEQHKQIERLLARQALASVKEKA